MPPVNRTKTKLKRTVVLEEFYPKVIILVSLLFLGQEVQETLGKVPKQRHLHGPSAANDCPRHHPTPHLRAAHQRSRHPVMITSADIVQRVDDKTTKSGNSWRKFLKCIITNVAATIICSRICHLLYRFWLMEVMCTFCTEADYDKQKWDLTNSASERPKW